MTEINLSNFMDKSIRNLFKDALTLSKNPAQALFVLKALGHQKSASRRRMTHEKRGIHVPPIMIASITHRCNLRCAGCYSQAIHKQNAQELETAKLISILEEARDLGVSIVLLAGGEPLVRREQVLEITAQFPEIIFPLFTNGMLIDDKLIKALKKQKNVVPVISIEGFEEDTDKRRGAGVYRYLRTLFQKFRQAGLFYGTSITLTRTNYSSVTDTSYLSGLTDLGCRLFFFIDYVPVKEGTDDWVLTREQQELVPHLTTNLRKELSGLFIAFPGDEEALGGCLAAGRGFVHISPEGNVEPCPFSPFSDTSLQDKSLTEALDSELLKTIRLNHNMLTEAKGGCALWENREWVESLISSKE